VKDISELPVDVLGLNCSVGPKAMLEALEKTQTADDTSRFCATQCRYPAEGRGPESLHDLS